MSKVYVGDDGTEIMLDTGADLTGNTSLQISARNPDGVTVLWPATQVGSTSVIKCITSPTTLNIAGTWKLQAKVAIPNWSGHGETFAFVVHPLKG